MRIPKTSPLNETMQSTSVFGGYDRRSVIDDGSWSDMENMTLDEYPTAKSRGKHGTVALSEGSGAVTGLFSANGKLGYTRAGGTVTFYDAAGDLQTVDLGLNSSLKKFVRMGAYLIILPDYKWVNTADAEENGDLNSFAAEADYSDGNLVFQTVKKDGTQIQYVITEPAEPTQGNLWYDVGARKLKMYDAGAGAWVEYPNTIYTKITLPVENARLAAVQDESIYFFCSSNTTGAMGIVGGIPKSKYYKAISGSTANSKTSVIIENNVCDGTLNPGTTYTVAIDGGVPNMDFIVESNNRLWGCKWGEVSQRDEEGTVNTITVNEIYTSALGSFKEWHRFDGVDADSYVASVGSDGPFTGAVSFQGRPVFFKERCMHVVFGAYPSAYQIVTSEVQGVEAGSNESLAIVAGGLFYKAPDGFRVYDGSSPAYVSDALGSGRYTGAIAGSHDGKYFVTAHDEDANEWVVLIYDARLGLWNRAEPGKYLLWCSCTGDMYYVTGTADEAAHTWYGTGTPDAGAVKWRAVTGYNGLSWTARKYVNRIVLRVRIGIGSDLRVEITYDDKEWKNVTQFGGSNLDSFLLYVPIRRCDHFRLRLSGHGDAQIYTLSKILQGGSHK